jgi:septal ring factor EnvC (AmiA/AmiB activator)
MIFLTTVWTYIKKFWQLALFVAGFIVVCVFFKERDDDLSKKLKEIQDAHDDEMKKIDAARVEQQRQHEENEKKLRETLAAIQSQYEAAKKDLDEKKKQEIIDIVAQYGTDPDQLAVQLSNVTGFTIILPPRG